MTPVPPMTMGQNSPVGITPPDTNSHRSPTTVIPPAMRSPESDLAGCSRRLGRIPVREADSRPSASSPAAARGINTQRAP